ncbi:MAG: hypothetical protein VB015_01430 [Erysipelotrichaceae bacterium]|nr:hypothetical protein [Erysipelotrichaceae bacterium]
MTSNSFFRLMSDEIKSIARIYFDSQTRILNVNNNDELLTTRKLLVKKVESAFNHLSALDKQFINNEFFYEQYQFWWVPIYSKSTFYRLKRKAMSTFLNQYRRAK